jgi:hypothetical protein
LEAQTTKGLGGKEPNMLIIGCHYHPSCQQIAFVDTETGELGERRLLHREEAEGFYSELKEQHSRVRVGRFATGDNCYGIARGEKEDAMIPVLLAIVTAAYGLWYGLFAKEFRAVHPWTGGTKYRYKPSPTSALWSSPEALQS